MKLTFSLFAAAFALSGILTGAAPPSLQAINRLLEDYFARRPSQGFSTGLNQSEALDTQKKLVALLTEKLGNPVGYKAGLVTKEAQEKFGVSAPVRGVLLSKMMLTNGAAVPANFGARPLCEADLMVVVKDEGINQATTWLEAARHLKEVVAFIELPDILLTTNHPVDGPLLTAINVGARLAVLGERVPVLATPEFVNALAEMTVRMTDQNSAELGKATGKILMDNPLEIVLWLVQDLARSGEKLKAGDLLSLGSLKVITPQVGQTITVRYEGLPGGPIQVVVHFR